MIEIPTFALLFQNFKPYFIPTFSMEGTWKPAQSYYYYYYYYFILPSQAVVCFRSTDHSIDAFFFFFQLIAACLTRCTSVSPQLSRPLELHEMETGHRPIDGSVLLLLLFA